MITALRRHRPAVLVATGGTVLALMLSACSSGGTDDSGSTSASSNDIAATPRDQVQDGGTMRWPIDQTIPNFNYNQLDGTLGATNDIIQGMLPSVFDSTADASFVLKKAYFDSADLTSTDPQVVTYAINPKARWNNGTAIAAADFIAQWKALNGTNSAFNVSSTTGYEDISKVEAGTSEQQVVVTFKKKYADWKGLFSPLYPTSVNSTPAAFNTSLTKGNLPVSAGPFKLQGFNATQQAYTAERDPNWWGNQAKLNSIVYRVLDGDAQVDALANGEIDVIDIGPDVNKYKRAQTINGVEIRRAAGPNFRHITFNGTSPILKDQATRQAIARGIDRQQIATALLAPLGADPKTLGNHIFMTNQVGYVDNSGVVAFDQAKAKSELDTLGWTQNGTYRSKAGKELTLNLLIPSGVATATQESALIQQQLKAIGVNVKITALGDDFFDGGVAPGKFDLTIFTWVGTPFPISSSKSIYVKPVGDNIQQNYARIGSTKIDDLFDEATAELDPAKAIDLGNQIDVQLWTEVHSLTTYQRPDLKAIKANLVNYGALGFATVPYEDIGFTGSTAATTGS